VRAIAEEHFAAISHLGRTLYALLGDARGQELARRHTSQVEARTVAAIGAQSLRYVLEVRGNLGTNLI
jgi:hypothetical protein